MTHKEIRAFAYSKSRMTTQEIPKTVDKIIVLPASVVVGSVEPSSVEDVSGVVEGASVDDGVVNDPFVSQARISSAASLLCQSRLA